VDDFEQKALAAGWIQRTKRQHTLRSTPRVGQVFWVDFPSDSYAPEFEKEHPGIIIRAPQSMSGTCIVVPMTHRSAENNPHAHKLIKNPNSNDFEDAWAICDHLYTVSLGRLRRFEYRGFPRDLWIDEQDKQEIFTKIQRVLHVVFTAPEPFMAPPAKTAPRGPNTLSIKPKQ
jgi:uncharacterized protein YifN (PemK superfamily)